MPADRTFAQLVADYLIATVEADGTFVRIQPPDILVDTATHAHVEARFGASEMLTKFRGAARPALRSGTILIIVDDTRERPAGTGGLGNVVGYEYDMSDVGTERLRQSRARCIGSSRARVTHLARGERPPVAARGAGRPGTTLLRKTPLVHQAAVVRRRRAQSAR